MNYTLHQLEIFRKIAEVKSVTKASEQLFLTQPAVSIQLKNFQDQFNLPLFEVVGRKLYITEFGEEISKTAAKILEQVAAINYKSAQFEGELAGKLKIAIVSTAKYVMPFFLADFMKQNERIDLTMDVTNKMAVIRSLENNDCDFAMVSTIPKKLNIDRIELMKNKLYFVANKDFIVSKDRLSIKNLNENVFIFREQGSATRLAMERFLVKHKVQINKKIELTSNEALKQAIIAGLGISIMPIIGIKNELQTGELQILDVKNLPLETNWNLIWLKTKNLSMVAKAFKKHIEEEQQIITAKHFSWVFNA
ncbi:LysR family transcriptional regulator [uncultured Polaribacter sp.]|uniref:LysR family transcriptional regulator n=1 Tax=uncultured Polaribacter sp. TaxID=174711 RepID=UPI002631388E|nr:LysR family transcriptional regulator [uncultured Polaribacter sp.]